MILLFRILFVSSLVVFHVTAVLISCDNELLMSTLLLFGITALILSSIPLEIEQHKRQEPVTLQLFLVLVTAALFIWLVPDSEENVLQVIRFMGFSLYLDIAGGFFLGILLSPVISRRKGNVDERVEQRKAVGILQIRRSGFLPVILFLGFGIFFSLIFAVLQLEELIRQSSTLQQALFWASSILCIYLVMRLAFRSSIWGDPQKYTFYNQEILDRYFGSRE